MWIHCLFWSVVDILPGQGHVIGGFLNPFLAQ
jgi:hypothetical protein